MDVMHIRINKPRRPRPAQKKKPLLLEMNQIVFGFFAEFLHVAPPHLPDHVHNDVHDRPKEGSSIDLHESTYPSVFRQYLRD